MTIIWFFWFRLIFYLSLAHRNVTDACHIVTEPTDTKQATCHFNIYSDHTETHRHTQDYVVTYSKTFDESLSGYAYTICLYFCSNGERDSCDKRGLEKEKERKQNWHYQFGSRCVNACWLHKHVKCTTFGYICKLNRTIVKTFKNIHKTYANIYNFICCVLNCCGLSIFQLTDWWLVSIHSSSHVHIRPIGTITLLHTQLLL